MEISDLSALAPVVRWYCQRCSARDVTRKSEPHTRFHACAGMGGVTVPLLREGDDARVRVLAREDYVGTEDVRVDDDGRPVMSAVTEYADGRTDVVVYAATAHGAARADCG